MILVLFIAFVIFLIWLLLMASGAVSIAWSRRSPETRSIARLALAIIPVALGIVVFNFHINFNFNEFHIGLSPFFLLPVVLGVVAIVFWILARQGNHKLN